MALKSNEDDEAALGALAEAQGISRREATVRAIHEAAARRGREQKVATASERTRTRYADLIHRLNFSLSRIS